MNSEVSFTVAYVPIENPCALRDSMIAHLREHDVDIRIDGDVAVATMPEFGLSIELAVKTDGLSAKISAPNEGQLHFMREELIETTEKIDPKAADAIRWDKKEAEPTCPINFHVFKVVGALDVLEGLRRVTVEGPAAPAMLVGPGFHVRAILPKNPVRPPVWPVIAPNGGTRWPQGADELHARVLTVRAVDPNAQTVEFDIALHDSGFVSDWARTAKPGSEVGIMGPGGEMGPSAEGRHLYICDRTAMAAVARNLALRGQESANLVIAACPNVRQAAGYFDRLPCKVVGFSEDELRGNVERVVGSAVAEQKFSYAWFGGEFSDAQTARSYFRAVLGLEKGSHLSVPYWRIGQAGEA
ncbi:MAG: siderophore-interacting protein [Pseudomonadota bacterium]